MERKLIRVNETQTELLLSGFKLVFLESLRADLDPIHQEYVSETLAAIATNCVNQGLGIKLSEMKNDILTEQRLIKLKHAYDDGELAQ